ncbi:hypothetical protein [Planctellipticum variicoloris]|uniref:hypothetical protein n=1 Tax=Planctellipticum variicoloris TaxID=3064265 RepID=UPI00301419F1|nr:hypothetical protein SH412_003708 [Planctomycetaceae bacterium SH412]
MATVHSDVHRSQTAQRVVEEAAILDQPPDKLLRGLQIEIASLRRATGLPTVVQVVLNRGRAHVGKQNESAVRHHVGRTLHDLRDMLLGVPLGTQKLLKVLQVFGDRLSPIRFIRVDFPVPPPINISLNLSQFACRDGLVRADGFPALLAVLITEFDVVLPRFAL